MSDYADGAEAMRTAILARFAELEDEWRVLRDTYDPREQYDDRELATREIEGYKTATGIVRGVILEDRRSMVCLTPRQAHGRLEDNKRSDAWMSKETLPEEPSVPPMYTQERLDATADAAYRSGKEAGYAEGMEDARRG